MAPAATTQTISVAGVSAKINPDPSLPLSYQGGSSIITNKGYDLAQITVYFPIPTPDSASPNIASVAVDFAVTGPTTEVTTVHVYVGVTEAFKKQVNTPTPFTETLVTAFNTTTVAGAAVVVALDISLYPSTTLTFNSVTVGYSN